MKRSEEEFDFEFPATVSVPNDVIPTRRGSEGETRPLLSSDSESSNGFVAWLRSPSWREPRRCRRNESCRRRRYNGLIFGTVMKFPLQMELSDIKMRQERRELPPPLRVAAKGDGGESCWELVRPLRRRGMLKNALLGCLVPIV